jgi:uncharacterized membrane protein HdeD (DUF308 family)
MTDELNKMAKEMATKNAPWAEGVNWWVVLIQAIALIGLGLFVLFVPDAANKTVVELLGLFLLLSGLIDAFQGIDNRVTPRALPYHMLSAGAGIAVGAIVLLDLWQDFMLLTAAAVVVSVGLLIYGIMGLIIWIGGGERGDRNLLNLILPLGLLALGGISLFSRLEMASTVIQWLGIASLIIGALLLVQTFILYGKQQGNNAAVQKQEAAAQVNAAARSSAAELDDAGNDVRNAAADAAKKMDSTLE